MAGCAMAVAAALGTGTGQAATVATLNGYLAPPWYVDAQFNYAVCSAPNLCLDVPYKNWGFGGIPGGVTALNTSLNWIPGPKAVFGYSEGAKVAYQWAREHPNAGLTILVTGNPEREYGGISSDANGPTPQNINQITDVAIQYDFFADFPNNPASPYYSLAVLNAILGIGVHMFGYQTASLDDPANIRYTEGNITYVLIPRSTPLSLGIAPINNWVQPLVEDAYIRPTGLAINGIAQATTPEVTSAAATSRATTPEVTSAAATSPAATPEVTSAAATSPAATPEVTSAAATSTDSEDAVSGSSSPRTIASSPASTVKRFPAPPRRVEPRSQSEPWSAQPRRAAASTSSTASVSRTSEMDAPKKDPEREGGTDDTGRQPKHGGEGG